MNFHIQKIGLRRPALDDHCVPGTLEARVHLAHLPDLLQLQSCSLRHLRELLCSSDVALCWHHITRVHSPPVGGGCCDPPKLPLAKPLAIARILSSKTLIHRCHPSHPGPRSHGCAFEGLRSRAFASCSLRCGCYCGGLWKARPIDAWRPRWRRCRWRRWPLFTRTVGTEIWRCCLHPVAPSLAATAAKRSRPSREPTWQQTRLRSKWQEHKKHKRGGLVQCGW